MKKQIGLFTAILFAVSTLMVGCKAEVHEHTFAEEWSSDETDHWHAATCEHTTEVSEKAEHTFGEWTVTKEATEEAEGSKERTCTVCECKVTESIEKLAHTHTFAEEWSSDKTNHWHAATCGHTTEVSGKASHSFGDWTVTKAATEEAEGSKERTCTVCGYTATEAIEKLAHTHKFATDWTKDETNHWHASTCGHEVTEDKTAHTFGDWITTKAATEEETGSKERVCDVCKYKDTEVIEKMEHKHTFAEEWSRDETAHWHAATCGHTTEVSGKASHSFGDWITTKPATEEETGSKERVCDLCKYKDTEVIEKLEHTHKFATDWTKDETNHWHASTCGHEVTEGKTAHTFGDWITTKAATEEETGSKERVCDLCKYKDTEVIAKLEHTHKFATEWTSDETNHWHVSTCGHEVTEGKTAHTFGVWITTKAATCTEEGSKTGICKVCKKEVTEKIDAKGHSFGIWEIAKDPTETESCQMQRECEVCGKTETKELEGFKFVKGTTITGTESWTPTSSVFVSGRKVTIPDLIVSDHEVTRGEYKAVMGSDPSTASAYDKDGKELEGDAVLNNPVNKVNWYDALVYCNKRSMAEGLTPCYSISASTNPATWGKMPTAISSNRTWDAATCNFEANGYRLPTEAEWEWLARGGENYEYAGSDTIDDVAWYKSNTNGTGTREVKAKAPNGYGLYDMSGNVIEWCWDRHGSISSSSAADGSTSGNTRVRRGGSWYSIDDRCQVAIRGVSPLPYNRYDDYGFRVVRQAN